MPRWLLTILLVAVAGCGKTIEWKEEPKTELGPVTVTRKVELNFSGGELSEAARRWPTKYQISVEHPVSKRRVSWKGEYGFNPVYLGFDRESTYLVILPMVCDAKIPEFSVPGLPYIYLKTADGKSWRVVKPNEFPMHAIRANLGGAYDGFWVKDGGELPQETVAGINGNLELSTGKFFQVTIPSTYDAWPYKHKKVGGYKGCGS